MDKKEMTMFGKFYPKTLRAFGGPKRLQKWMAGDDAMPTRVSRIFHAENDRPLTDAEEFEELSGTKLMVAVCG